MVSRRSGQVWHVNVNAGILGRGRTCTPSCSSLQRVSCLLHSAGLKGEQGVKGKVDTVWCLCCPGTVQQPQCPQGCLPYCRHPLPIAHQAACPLARLNVQARLAPQEQGVSNNRRGYWPARCVELQLAQFQCGRASILQCGWALIPHHGHPPRNHNCRCNWRHRPWWLYGPEGSHW